MFESGARTFIIITVRPLLIVTESYINSPFKVKCPVEIVNADEMIMGIIFTAL